MNHDEERVWLTRYLLKESTEYKDIRIRIHQ